MTAANFNYYYKADITTKWMDGDTEQTYAYSFINKPILDSIDEYGVTIWPILNSIGEISFAAGEYLPNISLSSIEIDNSRGSIGVNRRFSDILERQNVIGQQIVVSILERPNDVDSDDDWTIIASGRVMSYSLSLSSAKQTLTFQLSPLLLAETPITLEVSRSIEGMENAPDSSIGRALPFVLNRRAESQGGSPVLPPAGYQQVQPVRISADGSANPIYALSTLLYNKTTAGSGSGYIYIKKTWDDGKHPWELYPLVAGPSAPSIDISTPTTGASFYSLQTYAAIAFKIPSTVFQNGAIITQVLVQCKGNSTDPLRQSDGFLSVFFLAVNRASRQVASEIARGKIALSVYDALNNASTSNFQVKVDLDKPLILPGSATVSTSAYDYYIGFEGSDIEVNDLTIRKYSGGSGSPYSTLSRANTTTAGTSYNEWVAGTDTLFPAFSTPAVTLTISDSTAVTADGLSYCKLSVVTPTPETGQVAPSWDTVGIVVPMDGCLPVFPGGDGYSNPDELCALLCSEWRNNTWTTGLIDRTAYATQYAALFEGGAGFRGRRIAGIFEGKINRGDALAAIARGTACRFGVMAGGYIALYPWGSTASPAYNIPYEDIIPTSWDARDESTVVNDIDIFCDKRFAVREGSEGYGLSISYSAIGSIAFDERTLDSIAIYGNKPLVDGKFSVYGYGTETAFNDQGTPLGTVGLPGYLGGGYPDFLADYYITRFSKSLVYCSFAVPYHRYKTIKMFDVVTFTHPDFPAFWGTDPEPRDPPVDTGTSVVPVPNANKGHELIRAQTYRGFVEGVSYVLAMEHAPVIRLTVQVLLNQGFDPT